MTIDHVQINDYSEFPTAHYGQVVFRKSGRDMVIEIKDGSRAVVDFGDLCRAWAAVP